MNAPLVLLHAFPFGPNLWSLVVTELAGDSSGEMPIVVPALPGFEGTALPDAPPNLAVVADAVLNQLLAGDHAPPFLLAGVSLGGYVAMAMARRRPDLLAGLVLVDTKATADSDQAREVRLATALRAEQDPATIGELLVDQLLPKLLGPSTLHDRPEVAQSVRAMLRQAPPATVAWYQRAMAQRPDSLATLAELTCPVLVVYGDEDELSPQVEQDQMLAVLRSGHREVIDGAGHLSPIEAPTEVARTIHAFWKGLA